MAINTQKVIVGGVAAGVVGGFSNGSVVLSAIRRPSTPGAVAGG